MQCARSVRRIVLAHILDRVWRQKPEAALNRKLFKQIQKVGGLAAIAKTPASDELIAEFKAAQHDVGYAVGIVDYLLRSSAYSEDVFPRTIEHAKGFVWKSVEEYSVTKIGQIWEDYKLVAPYLYALHLEKSFRASKIERVDDVVDWTESFVKSSRRVERFLGRAAFAMDVINTVARDQRVRDFVDIARVEPPLRRFTDEDKLVSASIDRFDENYGKSFEPRRPLPSKK